MAKYLILIILCFTYQVNGQKAKTDSLKKVLVDTYEDSARMEICYYLSTLYKNNNYDSALIYSEKAYNLAQKVETQTKLIQYRRQVASILRLAGAYPEAQQLFLQNMEDASQSADSMTIRLAHQDLGSVFINLGDFDSATVHLVKAAELAADMGDLDAQAKSYGNLGMTLITHNDLKKALMYLQKSLDIYQEIENNVQVSACLLKISRVFVAQHNYEKALEYDLRALEIAKNTNHKSLLSIVYGELSSTNLDLRRLEAAKKYAELSLAIKREMNNKRGISASLYTLGGINLEQKNYQEALDKLLESQLLLEEMGAKEQIMIGLKTISKTYEELGDYKKAYTYFYNYSIMRDSIINETTAKQIADTETRYNVKEKEAKLEIQETQLELQKIQLTNQKILIASVVFLTTFLIVLLVFARKNIIQRKKINEQLNELDKSKSRFFTNVTHEIRTPLTLILAPLQNLLDKCTDQSTLQDLLLIKSNSKKLLTFLDEILQLSKLDSGKIIINNITLNLYEFCKRLFYAYQSLAQFRQIDYKFNFMLDKNISVEVDQGKLEVILNNLLSNAFKFSVSGSTISLIISQKDKKLLFFVSDTGQGIHPDDLPKIFMRYYQTSRKEKMANGGAGIGLSLAKEYSKLMGGGITVESEQGKGSRFILSIPFIKVKKGISQQKSQQLELADTNKERNYKPLLENGKKPKLLIVEDNLEMSRYLIRTLADDYFCTPAQDGIEALKILKKDNFSLIISDIMMPNMDGFEFREMVIKEDKWKTIPFIMLTARSPEEDKIKGLKLGIDDYITKPFNPKELFARINNVLSNKAERDQWNKKNQADDEERSILSAEQKLILEAKNHVLENISNTQYSVSQLAEYLSYSPRQLERHLKKQTGLSPNAFIREIKLQEAYKMLEKRQFRTVLEVSYSVGIDSPSYFSKKFMERFGKNPRDVKKSI